jgi:hypothetical protein
VEYSAYRPAQARRATTDAFRGLQQLFFFQPYGLPWNVRDTARDLDVAMFFASSRREHLDLWEKPFDTREASRNTVFSALSQEVENADQL